MTAYLMQLRLYGEGLGDETPGGHIRLLWTSFGLLVLSLLAFGVGSMLAVLAFRGERSRGRSPTSCELASLIAHNSTSRFGRPRSGRLSYYLATYANVAELADAQDLGFSLLPIHPRPPIASNDIELAG
jgi:hypothetical protein